jgi:hypothetical protein
MEVIREVKKTVLRTLTVAQLREMGLPNVISLPQPSFLVNNGVCVAKSLRYESEEAVRQSSWFRNGLNGSLVIVFDPAPENQIIEVESVEGGEVVVVRLFSFANWEEEFGEEDYSPLSMQRHLRSGALKPI